jgi:hypothetical protein
MRKILCWQFASCGFIAIVHVVYCGLHCGPVANSGTNLTGKMLYSAPAYIFYPLVMLWSLVYGSVAGVFFILLAAYENWLEINHYQLLLWKKYPQRSYNKYISGIWAHQIKGQPVELAEYTRHQIEKSRPSEPFPFMRLLINTCFILLITPFMLLSGLVKGPAYVYRRALEKRHTLWGEDARQS